MKELIISRTMVSDILLCIRVRKLKNEVHLETTLWNKHPYVTQKLSAELRKQRVLNLVQLLGIHENICKEFSHSKPLKCSLKYPYQQSGHEIFSLTKTVYLLCLTNLCCTKCVKIYETLSMNCMKVQQHAAGISRCQNRISCHVQ